MGNSECKFCTIIKNKENLLYEDDHIVIFNDIYPAAQVHLQTVPKKHIKNINHLNKGDLDLLKYMKQKTMEYLVINFGEDPNYELGFHIPPFNSIPHLHMHSIKPPFIIGSFHKFIKNQIFRSYDVVEKTLEDKI